MGALVVTLTTSGLKARDHRLALSPVTLLVGANGSGKSEALQALHLLARGSVPELPATADGVMRLARGDEIAVRATLADGRRVGRLWTRETRGKKRGSVTATIEGAPSGLTASAAAGALTATLGAWAESWRPDDLLALSADKMRRRLLTLVGGAEGEAPAELVADVPMLDGEDGESWRERARTVLGRVVDSARGEVRRLEAVVSSHGFEVRPDPAPVRARLATLRAELADAQQLADLQRELDAARARAAAGEPPGLSLADAQVARDKAEATLADTRSAWDAYASQRRAAESLAAEAARRVASIAADLRGLQRKGAVGLVDLADVAEAEDAREEALAADVAAGAALRLARSAMDAARARVRALSAGSPLAHCPSCRADLAAALADARVVAERYAAEAEAACAAAEARAAETGQALTAADTAQTTARLGSHAREALATGWPAVEAEARALAELRALVPPGSSLDDAEAAVRAARSTVQAAEASERATADARAAAGEVTALEARIAQIPPARPIADVEAEIQETEGRLVTIGAQLERVGQVEDDKGQLADAMKASDRAVARVERLAEYERGVLEAVRTRLEGPLSEAVGAPVTIELTDARGGATCRIHVGGVDVCGISTGERLRFVAALLVVLGRGSAAAWRPVVIDGIEAVSAEHRGPFLSRLVAAVEAGDVDQVVVAGCPDVVPDVPGVSVIHLGTEGATSEGWAA